MKIISFARTTDALLAGLKTVTRRKWKDRHAKRYKIGEVCQAWDRSPMTRLGKKVAEIEIQALYKEWLHDMPESDVEAEGGLWESKDAFIADQGGDQELWVVRLKLLRIVNGK